MLTTLFHNGVPVVLICIREAWTGPTVLGLPGFLERIRFAIDPDYENLGGKY